ncbi:stress protein [Streptacidiphilus sp. EB103A]|uniref:stress protein n=1 Tax=Streptacidiphilus sp. EB103A TaxID=3156275 RepID=UPI003510FE95
MTDTDRAGRTLASTASVQEFLSVEAGLGLTDRFAPVEDLATTVLAASFAGSPPVTVTRETLALQQLPPSAMETMRELLDLAGQQARGAWWLPESALVKAGPVNLPAYFSTGPRWASSAAALDSARVDLAANRDVLACWALLVPLADTLVAPLNLRGPQSGALAPEARDAAWSTVRARYSELGLLTEPVQAALAVLVPGNGWSRLTSTQQIIAKQALVHALAGAVNGITVARWRVTQLRPLLDRYYTKATRGQPTARAVLTKALQPALAAFFAGDWLAFLDYLGEQPARDEQIVTTLPEPRLYVQASAKVERIAAQKNLPADEVARMLASYLGTDEIRSPIEQRTAVLRRYWEAFDAAHAGQRTGRASLLGLVCEPWLIPGPDTPFCRPADERILPSRLLGDIEHLWRGEITARYPQRIVSTLFPRARMAEAFGPALRFWHEVTLTAWFICEGPYARTDLDGMAGYYAAQVEALAGLGTPIPLELFADLKAATSRLGPPRPIVTHHQQSTLAHGVTLDFSYSSGERRDGFEILRDIITQHRRTWAERHLETALRHAWEDALRDVARELNRAIASRGKPPTVKQFARVAAPVANTWFGGDLNALYVALGEKAPPAQERVHLLPYDLVDFGNRLFDALGGHFIPDSAASADPAYTNSSLLTRLITHAPRFVQLEELLGRQPTPEEFRAHYYTWPQDLTFDRYATTITRVRQELPKVRQETS